MKILILSNQARSMSNFWSVLIRRLRAAGHAVVCCAPPGDAAAEAALRALGARVVTYPLDRKGLNPLRDAASFFALLRIFRGEKPDLLFATTIKPVSYGCLAARMAGVPRIYATITGLGYAFEADTLFKKCVNRLGVALYRLALSGASGVFFQNEDDIRVFREQGILGPGARVFLTRGGTGVDTERFSPEPYPPLPPAGPVVVLLV
ncbi:MAG: glycosyltransferase, partial [Desulfovibrio sp.]|nr:glycosyltransferase [Desulfovibrio sp.]